jgi:hypothetical protein
MNAPPVRHAEGSGVESAYRVLGDVPDRIAYPVGGRRVTGGP